MQTPPNSGQEDSELYKLTIRFIGGCVPVNIEQKPDSHENCLIYANRIVNFWNLENLSHNSPFRFSILVRDDDTISVMKTDISRSKFDGSPYSGMYAVFKVVKIKE